MNGRADALPDLIDWSRGRLLLLPAAADTRPGRRAGALLAGFEPRGAVCVVRSRLRRDCRPAPAPRAHARAKVKVEREQVMLRRVSGGCALRVCACDSSHAQPQPCELQWYLCPGWRR